MAHSPSGSKASGSLSEILETQFHLSPTVSIGQAGALAAIREEMQSSAVPNDSLLLISDQPVGRGALFDASGARVSFPSGNEYDYCYVGLIDPSPTLRWAHSAWWAFVPADGSSKAIFKGTKFPESTSGSVRLLPVDDLDEHP
jgi:hypothetical protein